MAANPNWDWRLYGGHRVTAIHLQHRIEHIGWTEDLTQYYRSLAFDVGIGPLQRTPFAAAKSSLRAVEYAALGVPAVLSDEPPYRGWVTPQVTGFLIDPDRPGDWFEALDFLAKNPEARTQMGELAKLRAREWTTEAAIMAWVQAWDSVTETRTDNVLWLPKKGPDHD
jgi:glycosyltransferase involved in cell wall biosynthesis